MNKFAEEQDLKQQFYNLSKSKISEISSRLPDKKFYEFMYHAWFTNNLENVADFYSTWKPWEEWDYPIDDLVRFKKIILDNESQIKDKNVFDIGSHLGYLTLFCLNLKCRHIVGLEPRGKKLELSNFVCKEAGFDNFNFVQSSTHEEKFMDHAGKVDTVILSALIYHISDHFNVLKKITESTAKCLIIENREKKEIAFDSRPQVSWQIENTDHGKEVGGWHLKNKEILVGTPNQSFLNTIMFELGWQVEKIEYFYVNTHLNNKRLMSTSTYKR
tara:strand:- start:78 stop:896 length:819 start_codon:yes stop_codon:yes gene_type:complete